LSTRELRRRTAREAANLLYLGLEKEYKQAKIKAAKTLGTSFLPTNLEVALELDKMAEEREGSARKKRLVHMRKEALDLMKKVEKYSPRLIGSVWRGTIHPQSDIDITLFHDEPEKVLDVIEQSDLQVTQTKKASTTKRGKKKESFHIFLELPSGHKAELVIRLTEQMHQHQRCEIYGDPVKGLSLKELESLIQRRPAQRFVPI
jgi:predicted nucleotidyltransferase